jgi:hypothetical protein
VRGPWAEGPSAVTVTLPVAAPLETGKAAHVVVTLAEGAARGAGRGSRAEVSPPYRRNGEDGGGARRVGGPWVGRPAAGLRVPDVRAWIA